MYIYHIYMYISFHTVYICRHTVICTRKSSSLIVFAHMFKSDRYIAPTRSFITSIQMSHQILDPFVKVQFVIIYFSAHPVSSAGCGGWQNGRVNSLVCLQPFIFKTVNSTHLDKTPACRPNPPPPVIVTPDFCPRPTPLNAPYLSPIPPPPTYPYNARSSASLKGSRELSSNCCQKLARIRAVTRDVTCTIFIMGMIFEGKTKQNQLRNRHTLKTKFSYERLITRCIHCMKQIHLNIINQAFLQNSMSRSRKDKL